MWGKTPMSVVLSVARARHKVVGVVKTALGLFPVINKNIILVLLFTCKGVVK